MIDGKRSVISANWGLIGALCLTGMILDNRQGLHNPWEWATLAWSLVNLRFGPMLSSYRRGAGDDPS